MFKYVSESLGLHGLSKYPGFRLEMLKGNSKGIYSVRLNIAYRVLFSVNEKHKTIHIVEISKHEYNQ